MLHPGSGVCAAFCHDKGGGGQEVKYRKITGYVEILGIFSKNLQLKGGGGQDPSDPSPPLPDHVHIPDLLHRSQTKILGLGLDLS